MSNEQYSEVAQEILQASNDLKEIQDPNIAQDLFQQALSKIAHTHDIPEDELTDIAIQTMLKHVYYKHLVHSLRN